MKGRSLIFIVDHPRRVILTSVATVLVVGLLKYFLGLWADYAFHLSAWQDAILDAITAGALAGAVMHAVLASARRRRLLILREMSRIADLNHNVRNGLQVIVGTELMKEKVNYAVIESCHRIEETIERLFPAVGIERRNRKRHPSDSAA
jgi:hypothetical protein